MKFLIGIDEVGRGPLAGPVTIGVCICLNSQLQHVRKLLGKAKESKQLSAQERDAWKLLIDGAQAEGLLSYSVKSVSSSVIDKKGISFAIKKAMKNALDELVTRRKIKPAECSIKLDGGLYAPDIFRIQKTIIKGDEKELLIALASIVAKVTRDRYMMKISKKFPQYSFDIHKGYGTLTHRKQILSLGPCDIHRKSFLTKILSKTK